MPAQPPSSPRIEVATPDDAEAIARVIEASWRDAYRSILPAQALRSQDWRFRRREWARRTSFGGVFVARVGGRIVGVAAGRRNQQEFRGIDGILDYLYVAPEAQSQHVGDALLSAFARELRGAWAKSMVLWCLSQNTRARRFYERRGGRAIRLEFEFYGTVPVDKVAYAWPTLTPLISGRQ